MSIAQKISPDSVSHISDSRRDAEKYYKLLLAIESAIQKIGALEKDGRASMDDVLENLLPDLTEALDASQAFIAAYPTGSKNQAADLDLIATYPKVESSGQFLPWSKLLHQVLSDGRSRVAEASEEAEKFIEGLGIFHATTAMLVRMQISTQSRIVGVCNRPQPEMGPFLAADRKALESIVELIAIGLRVGEQRRQELEDIQNISAAINAELDPHELLPLIAQKASEVFSVPAASLMLWDKKRKNLVIEASHGLSSEYVRQQRIPVKKVNTIISQSNNARAIITFDLCEHPFGNVELIKAERLCSALSAQLQVSGELIGILNIYSRDTPRAFSNEERELAEILANHAAIAIRNAHMRQELHGQNKQRGEQLNALEQIALAITGELYDINELLKAVIQRATELVQGTGGVIYLWADNEMEIHPAVTCGKPDIGKMEVDKNRGIIREIKRTRAPFAISSYYRWSKRQIILDEYKLSAVIGVPILSGESLLGVIAVHTAEDRTFDKSDEQLLQRFANHAAIAMKNARAYAAEREAKIDLDHLVSSSLDGIIAVDKEGYVTRYNEGAERICGYGKNEILGQKTRVDKLFGDLEVARNINRSLFKQGKLDNYEAVLLNKNGQEVPITLSAILLKDNDGKHKGSVGFFKDLRPLRATLNAITTVTQAQDLTDGLNILAEGMVNSLAVTFCHILFLEPNGRHLKVEAAYPVARPHGKPLQWRPEIGKMLDVQEIPLMKHLLNATAPMIYRRGESSNVIMVTQHVQKMLDLELEPESVLLIPLRSHKGISGICTLGELRKWERSPFNEEKISLAQSIADQAANLIERLQTYEALRLREGLLRAGKEITSLQNLPKILQSIADGVKDAMGCDLVTLYTYNEAKDKIELPTISGQLDYPDALRALGYVSKKSIVWKILESKVSHFANDAIHDRWMVLDEADRHPGVEPFVLRERISSSAGIPLIMGKEKVGILFVNYRSNHPFLERERRDIELFATQAAIAINNVRLANKEEKKRKHLEAVINASKVITASVGLKRQEILEKILEQAVETIKVGDERKATLGTIQLFDEKTRELVFECAYPPNILSELEVEPGNRLLVGFGEKGVSVRAALELKPQLVPKVEDDPVYVVYSKKTKSELAVPLIDGNRLVGILDVENDDYDAFDEEDVEALKALTDMAVVALKNAEGAGQLSFANTVASMGAWGAEIAHDVNRETGAIQRKLYRLQNQFINLPPEVKKILNEIEGYAESLVLPPLPKRAPKPGENVETKNAVNLDVTVASYIGVIRPIYSDVVVTHDLHCETLRVAMHERWLHSLLRHLVRNAIKSLESRNIKRVLIRTVVQENFARVEIEDTGKGVRPELAPLLFQQPIPHEYDDRDGQGLLIVRFLVERHGGEIGLKWSRIDEGSCFYFTVPIVRTDVDNLQEQSRGEKYG